MAANKWREENSSYWRKYREAHSAYTEKNRSRQAERNQRARHPGVETPPSIQSKPSFQAELGRQILGPVIAKMGEVVREIRELMRGSAWKPDNVSIAKMGEQNCLNSASCDASEALSRTTERDCKDGHTIGHETFTVPGILGEPADPGG